MKQKNNRMKSKSSNSKGEVYCGDTEYQYNFQCRYQLSTCRERCDTEFYCTTDLMQDRQHRLLMPYRFSRLKQLLKRLDEAETRSRLLNNDVNNIRQEITLLKSTFTTLLVPHATSFNATTTRTRSRSTDSDESTVDGLSNENKKFKTTFKQENGYVVVFTDGSCENNGRPNAKAGIGVWFADYHPLNISKPVEGKATNNTAEIQACVEALKVLDQQDINKVIIFTDSQFTINCMTKWIKNWKKNNWKTASGGNVKNKEDLVKLDEAVKQFLDVKWMHVAGHQGIKGNEEADKLAREGALKYKPD